MFCSSKEPEMLTYSFENTDLPIYEYLYQCIRRDILAGRLKAGEKLPSRRSFAENHGISTITVQNAYEQLISEGYIFAVPKKGYYVADVSAYIPVSRLPEAPDPGIEAQAFNPDSNCNRTASPVTAAGPAPAEALESAGKNAAFLHQDKSGNHVIDLSANRTSPSSFPFSIWAKLLRSTISAKQPELMIPSPTSGIPELRSAIAGHLQSFRGVSISPEQIVIGAGTEYLYGLLVQLLGSDKTYCVENPGYKKLTQIYASYHVRCCFAGLDAYGISIRDLEMSEAQIAHISPTHHFPTGITMPVTRRYEVLGWAAADGDRYIIEDDYDSEFRQNGRPIPPLIAMDRMEKVIYINTFSKSLTPTIRISYMVLPPHLAERFRRELSFYACTVSNFEQYTLAAFIAGGYFEKHINRMRLFYRRRRDKILKCISSSRLAPLCSVTENDSGLHFLLKLKTSLSDREVSQRLLARGVRLQALSEYNLEKSQHPDSHIFLLNYSNIDPEELRRAADILADIIKEA